MAIRSKDFVGIAEGIRSHELSAKDQIEKLKGRISELSGRKSSLNGTISYLEAAIAAAYEDTDEDGYPDYGLIAALEAEKNAAKSELAEVEQDLDTTDGELEDKQDELEEVEEEKAQTLFEIQERARKTSNNINLAGGMYGAYASVGETLQNALQGSLSSLTQAAGILGGSVDSGSSGSYNSSASGTGHSASGQGGSGNDTSVKAETGALAAFMGGNSSKELPLSAEQFSTSQDQLVTPATSPNYHSGKGTINAKPIQNFATEQSANEYALSSFGENTISQAAEGTDRFESNQSSSNMGNQFSKMSENVSGTAKTSSHSSSQHTFADWLNPDNYTDDGRYIGEGQDWGYKPYGNDSGEFANSIMTAEQRALNNYMQAHNYSKADFEIYAKDAKWQSLHWAAHPTSGVIDTFRGSASARQQLEKYMNAHNYSQADFATFSRDWEWQWLHRMAYPDSDAVSAIGGTELALQHLKEYVNEHNYSQVDYPVYSRDPEWKRLHRTAYPTFYSNAKIKDRAHHFFNQFFNENSGKANSAPDVPSTVNSILAGKFNSYPGDGDSLKQKFETLKDLPVNKLSKKNLETIVDIAITNLKNKYQDVALAERFSNLAQKISFVDKLTGENGKYIYGYYDQKSDTIKVNMDANATVGDILATVDHEATHLLSQLHKNRVGGVKNPDILYGNVGMNEGITEMYSIKNMQSINPEYKSDSYVDEVEVMKEFEKICGEKNLLYAYMHNDLSYIREDMNQCIGNKKAFEKFCNDLDILYHYNYVDPDSVKAVFERQSAKQRIYQKLKKYQMGKKNAIREANYKTQSKDIPYSGSRESKNATSEYRIKFHKKEQETSITKNDDDFVNQKDKHRSFVESYYGGISLEKQKATVDDWIERQKTINSASSGGDPYKEERELSLPER